MEQLLGKGYFWSLTFVDNFSSLIIIFIFDSFISEEYNISDLENFYFTFTYSNI